LTVGLAWQDAVYLRRMTTTALMNQKELVQKTTGISRKNNWYEHMRTGLKNNWYEPVYKKNKYELV